MFGAIAILLLACTNYLYSRPYTASDIGEGVSRTSYEIGNTNNRTRIVPSAKSGKRYLSVVLRTWQEDAQLALLGMQSAVERIPDNQLLELVIVTDQTSADVVQSKLYQPLLEQYQGKGYVCILIYHTVWKLLTKTRRLISFFLFKIFRHRFTPTGWYSVAY